MKWLIPVIAVAICCLFVGGLILVVEINQSGNENQNDGSNGGNPVLGSVGVPNSPVYSNGNIQVFLKVEGVTGESTDAKHLGWIEVNSYNWSVLVPQSNGRVSGVAASGNFMVVAETSRATPILFQNTVTGKQLAVTIAVQSTDGNGKAVDICTWKLSNTLITSYNTNYGVDGTSRVYDVYGFTPTKVEVTTLQINADGSPSSPISAAWEIRQPIN